MKENQPDYLMFKKWFTQNGGLVSQKVQFPKKFPPLDYTGIASADNIKANQAIIAIPKKIIISVSKVRDSALGPILQKYDCLSNTQNQQTQFNIITLYLIWQKMLGPSSFFYPYLQSIGKASTIIQWSDEDIQKLEDPYITLQVVNQLRDQFPPIHKQFYDLSVNHPQLFKQPISWQLFMDCYEYVMTRCFGWGLPETLMVPFADNLNHFCHGVHHYTFNRKFQLENSKSQESKQYIIKRKQVDLTLLGINNKAELPITYEMNSRQKYIYKHKDLLQNQLKIENKRPYNSQTRLHPTQCRQYLETIHKQLLQQSYDTQILASSNSEDNDSETQQKSQEKTKQNIFKKQLQKLTEEELEPKFQEPKPLVNREFEDDVKFDWWYSADDSDVYFIVVTERYYEKGEQIFNSYGRRTNKFLLIWYGFTHFNNKYDSISFRFWDQQTYTKTGKYILVRSLTQNYCRQNSENMNITDEYRLKKDNLNYQLMAYLRYRIIRQKENFRGLFNKKLITIYKIHNLQLQRLMLSEYKFVLSHLEKQYRIGIERQPLSDKYWDYFANILHSSNRQILQNHYRGINMLQNTLSRLQQYKQKNKQIGQSNLLEIYRSNLCKQEQQCEEIYRKHVKFQNRKFLLDYFKMLAKHFRKFAKF